MITESVLAQYYVFFLVALLVAVAGALIVAMVDAKQNRTRTRPTSKLGPPISQR